MLSKLTIAQRRLMIVGGIVILVILWSLFRPELLFVKKSVDEPLPGATSSISAVRTLAELPSKILLPAV